ncbi:hypothetical protein [Listeria booriae]|uniref:Uncharacterized protein n=1 Tax=Listeria booriae TaxID=1552123 RepID=A0A7X1CZC0_9LIST|nr:hypothetical protein [Listeria booriae]MBC2022903.1 hypothetical protein [Listeria booriae]MBC2077896.1 hypothetical protein [Listeria booriae]MBC2117308.1 hypothetical protein [Listeria booriae]MBC2206425.1 hypothetical protein [Listeria booriae]
MTNYPKLYLGIDNCFAIKRWVEPETWIPLLKEIGVNYAEASFDNEIDFLYSPQWYINDWFDRLTAAEEKYDFKVKSFYSGYQTYRTAGLAHPNPQMANNLVDNFFLPVLNKIKQRHCSIGFSVHTYPENVLQNPEKFYKVQKEVWDRYAKLVNYSKSHGNTPICVEQMYTPAQSPWTIKSNINFIRYVYALNKGPIYTTIDVGHVVGQRKHRFPAKSEIIDALAKQIKSNDLVIWLGGNETYQLWDELLYNNDTLEEKAKKIMISMAKYPYLFSNNTDDCNPYKWLEELACYSPLMHLQQTNGISAPHAPFSKENNEKGIINGKEFLEAIKKAYDKHEKQPLENMPPIVDEIYLNFELFFPSTEPSRVVIEQMKETVAFWREFIPKDGLTVDELLAKL